jgi:hypothetical protein
MSTVVYPHGLTYDLLLTAQTAISHHDPAVQDESNRMLFNRQKQILARPVAATQIGQHTIDEITLAQQVPVDMTDMFRDLTFPEFVAIALVRTFADAYNSDAGVGLFSGMERYANLENRLHQAAVCSPTLAAWWNRLTATMLVPIHGGAGDRALFGLLKLPASVQQSVLRVLSDQYRAIVSLGRLWHATNKLTSADYAAKAGQAQVTEFVRLHWDATGINAPGQEAEPVEVPAVSGNSLRHQVVREPAWWHLCQHLGLPPVAPGKGPLPAGGESLFVNGGNIAAGVAAPDVDWARIPDKVRAVFYNGNAIAAGSKQPSNTHALALTARDLYPSLDLLGGVTDSFDMGESNVRVGGWLVCAENRQALEGTPAYDLPNARISAFDMLDDVTLTHQAGRGGIGQMIFSFETLCAGTQIVCRMTMPVFAPVLTRGALVAAVETYLADDGTLGGQAARGYGWMRGEWLRRPEGDRDYLAEYETYLTEHHDALLAGLVDGTLGTGSRILS